MPGVTVKKQPSFRQPSRNLGTQPKKVDAATRSGVIPAAEPESRDTTKKVAAATRSGRHSGHQAGI